MRKNILHQIIDLLFPRFCPICGNRLQGEEEIICMKCNLHLPRTDTWRLPYENEMAKMFWHQIPIEKSCALFYYQSHSATSNLIYQLKYYNHQEIGFYLGKLLAEEGKRVQFFDDIDGIVPIPLAKERKRQRGYNQCEAIAQGIQEATGLPIIKNLVRRNIFVESQTHKNRWDRRENVSHVFELGEKYKGHTENIEEMRGKHLLIVDDVCTTGATIISCCQEMVSIPHIKFSVLTAGWTKG